MRVASESKRRESWLFSVSRWDMLAYLSMAGHAALPFLVSLVIWLLFASHLLMVWRVC